MARKITPHWQKDFPMREEVEHFSGKSRTFMIDCHEGALGWSLRAREENAKGDAGYEFGAYSETSPYDALGRLRMKMRRALATRHLSGGPGKYGMLHDRIRGQITWTQKGGTVLMVDGQPVGMDDLASLLATHEGFQFELEIRDSLL